MLHVVVGILFNRDQQVLIALRQAHQSKGGFWEFPGGKVEAGESAYQSLCREFQEEIGITVLAALPFTQVSFDYPDKTVLLDTWRITHFEGDAIGAEGQLIRWVDVDTLNDYSFPEANRVIVDKLLSQENTKTL